MIHPQFIERLKVPVVTGTIDTARLREDYSVLLEQFNDNELLLEYLEHYGEAVFMDGIFSFVNPFDYEELLKSFPKLKIQSIMPFARTAMGNFYLIGQVDDETCLAFYNIHTEEYKYVDYEFDLFFKQLAGSRYHMESEAYGLTEFPALETYGPVAIDECLSFMPALALGGEEQLKNIQKVNLKEQLQLLAQAFS